MPFRAEQNGGLLSVRVTPNARHTAIDGIETRDDGSTVLRLRVTAPPDKGKANKAVIALVAKSLGLAKSAVTLKSGETARLKTLALSGDPAELAAKLANMGKNTA